MDSDDLDGEGLGKLTAGMVEVFAVKKKMRCSVEQIVATLKQIELGLPIA